MFLRGTTARKPNLMSDGATSPLIAKSASARALSKLYQHCRVRGHPCGLQDTLSTLRPSCSPRVPPRRRHGRKTRYGWVARPYPTGTFTLQETPSFSWRDNARPELLPEAGATEERTLEAVSSRPWLGGILDTQCSKLGVYAGAVGFSPAAREIYLLTISLTDLGPVSKSFLASPRALSVSGSSSTFVIHSCNSPFAVQKVQKLNFRGT